MKDSIEIVVRNGARIIDSDYSGLTGDALTACIHKHNDEIQKLIAAGEKDIRFLTNVTGTIANRDAVELLKRTAAMNLPYTKKSAAVGVVGMKKILLQAINLFSTLETVPFNTRDEALEWLAKD